MNHNIKHYKNWQWLLLITLLGLFILPAQAAIPDNVDYQGYLTDSGGSPINGTVSVTFSLYNIDSGGISLWTDTQSVTLTNGLFNVKLGRVGNTFPIGLFDAPLWLGIDVASDGEMTPRTALSSAGFAHKADDALTLDGQSAASLDQSAHVTDTGNPHSVTAAQTGAVTSTNFALHTGDASAHHAKYTDVDAVTAMGVLDNTNPLHHDRRTGGQVFNAILSRDGAGSTLDADLLDGADSSAFANALHTHAGSLYGKVAVVAQSGGDYTSPLDAMTNLATWCGIPSVTNPCLVRILPGVYDLGNNGLSMQPYVDIEGSGENTTTITSTNSSGAFDATSATVVGADSAEIRFVAVDNQGGSTYAFAIYNNAASPKMTNVTATALGGSSHNIGVLNYISSSPTMTNVTATASGGINTNRGVYNMTASSPIMTNVTVATYGGTYSYGVNNTSSSSPAMTNVKITSSGGTDRNFGVYNVTSSPTIVGVSSNGIFITGNTFTVPATGTATENGTLLLAANNELTGLAGIPSATNRYVIKLDAGTYDLGNNGFTMQPYVDIMGSGENATTVSSTHSSGTTDATSATVIGADNAEIRFLTVENQGGSTYAIAIYNYAASPIIAQVTATASGGSGSNYGVSNESSSPVMKYVTVFASGGAGTVGVWNSSSSPTMTNLTAIASGGSDGNYGVYNYTSSSPIMNNVTATASGGTYSQGVHNFSSSSPAMNNVIATASGGDTNYGVNNLGSSPAMTNVTATASGGSLSIGVYNASVSSPIMMAVTATASGGTASYGVRNYTTGFISFTTIMNSSISGTTNSIDNTASTINVGTTMLDGTVTGTGFTCVGVYGANFVALGAGCI